MDESDAFLVARATRRDRDAFSQLYNRYFDRIFRFAQFRLNNTADAEDLASGVFFNAWRVIDQFSPKHDGSFRAWLFRLAHNAVVDTYRRGHEVLSLDATETMQLEEECARPEDDLDWRLTLISLRQALTALTDEQRVVVLLRFIEGFSAREVGDIIGKQEGAVRGMQLRALDAMRRALKRAREGDTLD